MVANRPRAAVLNFEFSFEFIWVGLGAGANPCTSLVYLVSRPKASSFHATTSLRSE
jgi:hypothetical protein